MARILSIETATTVCSVAIHNNNTCLAISEIHEINAHSSKLTNLIEEVLHNAQIEIADLDAVAISKGPGSYTGLRIGISLAKGICYGANKPLIAIDTLEAIALHCKEHITTESNIRIMPMIDARRMEVYTSLWNENMKIVEAAKPYIITEDSLRDFTPEYTWFLCGDGSEKTKELLHAEHIQFVPNIFATAKTIGILAQKQFAEQDFADIAYFEPLYLKDFVTTTPKKIF